MQLSGVYGSSRLVFLGDQAQWILSRHRDRIARTPSGRFAKQLRQKRLHKERTDKHTVIYGVVQNVAGGPATLLFVRYTLVCFPVHRFVRSCLLLPQNR